MKKREEINWSGPAQLAHLECQWGALGFHRCLLLSSSQSRLIFSLNLNPIGRNSSRTSPAMAIVSKGLARRSPCCARTYGGEQTTRQGDGRGDFTSWWEANQIPRVKVAKVDLSTARNEQTPYMPEIPEIPKCSTDLCASKEWEDTFINYFSGTRLAFSKLDSSDVPSISEGMKNSSKPRSSSEPQTDPTLTMIRNMDAVSRAATLRNYIDMIQSSDTLSRNDCLWLFALCIAVDAPFDAETCASLRSLLRKCATILTTKSEMDDEVVMLNILIAISGRYFGQYENR